MQRAVASLTNQARQLRVINRLPDIVLPDGNTTNTDMANTVGTLMGQLGKQQSYFMRNDLPMVCPVDKENGERRLERLDAQRLRTEMENMGRIMHRVLIKQRPELVPGLCSEQTAKMILAAQSFRVELPAIDVLSPCPVLINRHGRLVQICGYDRQARILAEGVPVPEIPFDVAVELLLGILQDFQFTTPPDQSRAVAAIITPALIFGGLLKGRAPLDVGEANDSQAGKGFRNRLTTAIYRTQPAIVAQREGGVGGLDEDFGNTLMAGKAFISFDNIRGRMNSQMLESALTESTCTVRVPYLRGLLLDPTRTVIMLTSNKAEMTNDLSNRASCVRIIKHKPGHQFLHFPEGDLLDHLHANQPAYLGAVFSVIRYWFAQGCPRTDETRHDFRPWAQTLDWIVRQVFHLPPLLDGHREIQIRLQSAHHGWHRDVALAIRKSRPGGGWVRMHEILDVIAGIPEIDKPGLGDGDLTDPQVRNRVLMAMGGRFKGLFGDLTAIDVEGLPVSRKGVTIQRHDGSGPVQGHEYCFTPSTPPVATEGGQHS